MAASGVREPERVVRLFVGNLSYDATEGHIAQALHGCSGVTFIGIRRLADTKRSRGHAHVEFSTEGEALRAAERLQGIEINGRRVRVDWCDQAMRRKHPLAVIQGVSGCPRDKSDGDSAALEDTAFSSIEILDRHGKLTPAALEAAEGLTVEDLGLLLDEIQLLLPSTGPVLQQMLQESPLLRAALLQAQLLVGRHEPLDFDDVNSSLIERSEETAMQRLLVECQTIRPPTLPALIGNNIGPVCLGNVSQQSGLSTQDKTKDTKSTTDKRNTTTAIGLPFLQPKTSPGPEVRSAVLELNLSPVTPDPPVPDYLEHPEILRDSRIPVASPPLKRKRGVDNAETLASLQGFSSEIQFPSNPDCLLAAENPSVQHPSHSIMQNLLP